jgi:hypothetical protein
MRKNSRHGRVTIFVSLIRCRRAPDPWNRWANGRIQPRRPNCKNSRHIRRGSGSRLAIKESSASGAEERHGDIDQPAIERGAVDIGRFVEVLRDCHPAADQGRRSERHPRPDIGHEVAREREPAVLDQYLHGPSAPNRSTRSTPEASNTRLGGSAATRRGRAALHRRQSSARTSARG